MAVWTQIIVLSGKQRVTAISRRREKIILAEYKTHAPSLVAVSLHELSHSTIF